MQVELTQMEVTHEAGSYGPKRTAKLGKCETKNAVNTICEIPDYATNSCSHCSRNELVAASHRRLSLLNAATNEGAALCG
jgi:hypothetical protein